MKRKKIILRAVIFALLIVVVASAFFTLRAKAQDDIVSDLKERLVAQDIPLDSIVIRSRSPFLVEIRLKMINEAGNQLTEDTWNIELAHHEASISHRYGMHLDGYYISYVSESGKVFEGSFSGLKPDSLVMQPFISDASKLDNLKTEALLLEVLNFGGMNLDELDVSTGAGSRDDVQTLVIRLSVLDVDAAVYGIPRLVGSIRTALEKVNEEHESTQISICRVWVLDETENELLEYNYDLEARREVISTRYEAIDATFGGPMPEVVPPSSNEAEIDPTITPTIEHEPPMSPPRRTRTPTPDPYP